MKQNRREKKQQHNDTRNGHINSCTHQMNAANARVSVRSFFIRYNSKLIGMYSCHRNAFIVARLEFGVCVCLVIGYLLFLFLFFFLVRSFCFCSIQITTES